MPTSLAMCFDAPLQSWGTLSRFVVRDTAAEPTKSGVVGLLGAALGKDRDDVDAIAALAALRLGVRVDREGVVERDYHTVQNVPTTKGAGHRGMVTERYYLADALFLVALEGDPYLLRTVHAALQRPRWPLYFGRKAFPPARPLVTTGSPGEPVTGAGVVDQPLEDVLRHHPWLETQPETLTRQLRRVEGEDVHLRTVAECTAATSDSELRHDHPISFTRSDRRYASREVRIGHVPLTREMVLTEERSCS